MNWDYIAGFFDGEGNVCKVQRGKAATCYLRFANKDRKVLEEIAQFLQVGYIIRGNKGVFHLVIGNHNKVFRIAEELVKRCVIKKAELEDLIRFIKGRVWRNDTGFYVVSKKELYELYWEKKLSLQIIAKMYNRSVRSLRHKMDVFGIPRRSISESLRVAWDAGRRGRVTRVSIGGDLSEKEQLLGYC